MALEETHDAADALCSACDLANVADCSGFPILSTLRLVHSIVSSQSKGRGNQSSGKAKGQDEWDYCGIPGGCGCSLPKVCAKDRCECNRRRVCIRDDSCSCGRMKLCANPSCGCSRPKIVLDTSRRFKYTLCAKKGKCSCRLRKVCVDSGCSCDRPKVGSTSCSITRCHCSRPKVVV